ncbi:hypothetical protein F5B20DRAFT_341208 [Whalleya microplaca]|nr:hypothetical protein F5B20DRAFT_341208 [Whalleya microplaca]
MLFAYGLWTPVGLLMLGVKYSYGGAGHEHYPYFNISSSRSTISKSPSVITESTSTIIYENCTTSSSATIPSVPSTIITSKPVTSYSTISSNSTTTTIAVPSTVTLPTPSSFYTTTASPVFESCPTTCSISAGTVNLFYWPTNNDYTYPSTYIDTAIDYTFTSPSVYMVINTIFGYNTFGRTGPSASSPIFALDLGEVSTIAPDGQATRQLSLSDLGTDCPQSEDPSVIATMAPDGRCDPILLAPDAVKSWALPCNACGRFGLFDPPYAVPPLDGGLVGTTTTTTEALTTGTALPATTATPAATGASSTAVPVTSSTDVAPTTGTSVTTSGSSAASSSASSDPATVVTASATRVMGGLACLMISLFVSISLL